MKEVIGEKDSVVEVEVTALSMSKFTLVSSGNFDFSTRSKSLVTSVLRSSIKSEAVSRIVSSNCANRCLYHIIFISTPQALLMNFSFSFCVLWCGSVL